MKKTIKLLALFLFAGATILTSCSKDEDEIPVEYNPTINFLVEQGYIYEDATMRIDSIFKIKVHAEQNATSKKKLETLEITRIFNLNSWDTTFQIDDEQVTIDFTINAQSQAGDEKIEFEVMDKDGKKSKISLIITTYVPANAVDVSSYPNITLGSWNDPTYGSFFVSTTGEVMDKATATQNQDKIDFVFYLGDINGPTIGAPSNTDVKNVFNLEGANWTIFNETMFQFPAPIDDMEFDAIGDKFVFPEFTGADDDAKQLGADDVVYFKTVNDKLGFIKVNSVNARGDIINIDVKVMD